MNVAVFLEDAIAVGVGVAAIGISLTAITGNMAFDALGSIGVGLLMGGLDFVIAKIAGFLARVSLSPRPQSSSSYSTMRQVNDLLRMRIHHKVHNIICG